MKKNKRQPYKKNARMLNNYKQYLRTSYNESEDTVNNDLTDLEGTDSSDKLEFDNIPIQKKGINLKIIDWLKDNWISMIIVPIIAWMLVTIIDHKVSIGQINTKIEEIDKVIEKLDDTYERKNEIEIELNNIKSIINMTGYTDIKVIEMRIEELEKKINSR